MNIHVNRTITYEYEKKRDTAFLEAEKRKKEIYENYPEIKAINEQLKLLGLHLAKAILKNEKDEKQYIEDVNRKIEDLKKTKQEVMHKYGVEFSSFEPVFECSSCKDTGYIEEKHGQMCFCYRQKLINMAYKQSNLELLGNENFETFNSEVYLETGSYDRFGTKISPRENILRVKDRCQEFIRRFDNPSEKNLLFTGDTGLGKTFMANCIAKELLDIGKTVIYQTAPRLLDIIMDYKMRFDRHDCLGNEEYNSLFEVDLLIIDDLGLEGLNKSRYSELLTIINTRLLTRQSKCTKTIISTNLSLEKMNEYYDDRMISRILGEYYICKFFGDDIRLKTVR